MENKASTAILVKSRAKYGKRLTEKDYDSLLACTSVSDIAAYLKANTHYSAGLENVKEAALHRGSFEALLKGKMFRDFTDLCKFERSVGEHYFEYILLKSEIDGLIHFFRYFMAGNPQKHLMAFPDFYNRKTDISLSALAGAKSFDDVLNALKNTRFYKLLAPFRPMDGKALDFQGVEAALDKYLYKKSLEMFEKEFTGEERNQLIQILSVRAELENIRKIYRAKFYYNSPPDVIRSLLNSESRYLKKRHIDKMIGGKTAGQVIDVVKSTKYGRLTEKTPFTFIDDFAARIMFDFCRRKVRFSSYPAVVMASVITLFDIEIENITNIIEGRHYGVELDNIRSFLILM
ncbi:MAG: V-type ATPase subunit [Oscillospiraceae bacterium]|nr:V-type ATPase subunit [Oscillospiraceae bacterium]